MQADLAKADEILINRLDSDVDLIKQMSNYIISSGGKRLRPLLLMLCARATNYKGEHHHTMAVVIELIHTATLLHDDVVDDSTTRRGKETANEIWGVAPSVLVGDFLYSRAFEIMVESDSMTIIRLLSKATNNIAQGEVIQLLNIKNADISQEQYFYVIKRKTACLFEVACKIGGILSNSSSKTVNALGQFGFYLGNTFQIIDDVLDYESDFQTMGKEVGDDLAEGKATLPMIYALEQTSGAEHAMLREAIENADNSDIEDIINVLVKVNAFEFTRNTAKSMSQKAINALESLPESDYRSALKSLCNLSLKRNS